MFHPNDKIGPYSPIRTLGHGAFAAAWAAGRAMTMEQAIEYALEEPANA